MIDRTPKNTRKNEISRRRVHMLLKIKNVKKTKIRSGLLEVRKKAKYVVNASFIPLTMLRELHQDFQTQFMMHLQLQSSCSQEHVSFYTKQS